MNEITEKKRVFECPHCHCSLEVKARMEILNVSLPSHHDPLADLPPNERMVLEDAKSLGIINSFALVTSYAKGSDAPRDMGRHFLTFLRTANARRVPRFALDYFVKTLGHGNFQFWQGQGVGAVVISDFIRLFIPLEIVVGTIAKGNLDSSIKQRIGDSSLDEIMEWVSKDGAVLRSDQFVSFTKLRKAALNGLTLQN